MIQAAYRRLAQKYHPDRQPDADGVDRMVAINAAWEMVRDPARRAAYDRQRASMRPTGPASPARPAPSIRHGRARAARSATAATAAVGHRRILAAPVRECRRDPAAGDRVARLDVGSIDHGRRLRPADDAGTGRSWRRGSAAGQPVGDGPQVRAVRGLVARRDRPEGPRVPRVARPDGGRPRLPRRDRPAPAAGRVAGEAPTNPRARRGLFRRG